MSFHITKTPQRRLDKFGQFCKEKHYKIESSKWLPRLAQKVWYLKSCHAASLLKDERSRIQKEISIQKEELLEKFNDLEVPLKEAQLTSLETLKSVNKVLEKSEFRTPFTNEILLSASLKGFVEEIKMAKHKLHMFFALNANGNSQPLSTSLLPYSGFSGIIDLANKIDSAPMAKRFLLQNFVWKRSYFAGKMAREDANRTLINLNMNNWVRSGTLHDINNRAGALDYISLLGEKDAFIGPLDVIKTILSNVKESRDIIKQGRDWVNKGRIYLRKMEYDFHLSTNALLLGVTQMAATKKIEIFNRIEPNTRVFADEKAIKTVIDNLVRNAIKFTMPGGSITISAEQDGRKVHVSIADTGIGIPLEKLPDVLGGAVTTPGTNGEPGTGVGLGKSKLLVEAHGTKLHVHSVCGGVNSGTTFSFSLRAVEKKER